MPNPLSVGLSQLSSDDMRQLLEFSHLADACTSMQELGNMATNKILPLFDGCSSATWNVMTPGPIVTDFIASRELRESLLIESTLDVINERMHVDHPLVRNTLILEGKEARPVQISDFSSTTKFKETPLYRESYNLMEVRNQLCQWVAGDESNYIILILNRALGNFDARETALYAEACAILTRSSSLIHSSTKIAETIQTLSAYSDDKTGIIQLRSDGSVKSSNHRAERWLDGFWNHAFGKRQLPTAFMAQNICKTIIGPNRFNVSRHLSDSEGAQLLILRKINETPPSIKLLTKRQRQVLTLAAKGYPNMKIATTLSISVRTVEKHFEAIFTALNVNNRTAAIVSARI